MHEPKLNIMSQIKTQEQTQTLKKQITVLFLVNKIIILVAIHACFGIDENYSATVEKHMCFCFLLTALVSRKQHEYFFLIMRTAAEPKISDQNAIMQARVTIIHALAGDERRLIIISLPATAYTRYTYFRHMNNKSEIMKVINK